MEMRILFKFLSRNLGKSLKFTWNLLLSLKVLPQSLYGLKQSLQALFGKFGHIMQIF